MCFPHSSLEWYQKKVIEVGNIEMSKIEMKKEKVYQNNCSGIGLVDYGVENESGKIDVELLEKFKTMT